MGDAQIYDRQKCQQTKQDENITGSNKICSNIYAIEAGLIPRDEGKLRRFKRKIISRIIYLEKIINAEYRKLKKSINKFAEQ